MSDPTPQPIEVGTSLGQYKLVELIAIGGMGRVYRAFDKSLERFVAVKVLAPELARDPQVAARFLAEARAAANLNHPNIVHVYTAGQQEGAPYFVMELVEGEHLEALLNKHRQLHVREAVGFVRQAALGLQHAHQNGLIHGDVKPANFIVSNTGTVKVMDFGLARRVKGAAARADAEAFGTPGYVSPEVIQGLPPDHRSDIYSLGCTLYHLLAGRPPFQGATTQETLDQQVHLPPPAIQQFNPKVPPVVAQILARMLAKQPEDRYQNYGELIQALDRFLGDRPMAGLQPLQAPRETLRRPPALATTPGAPTQRVTPPPPPKQSWLGVVFTLISLAACALIVVLIYKTQFAGRRLDPGITNVVVRPTPAPAPAPPTNEQQAELELTALKADADAAELAGEIGRAYTIYGQWPAERFAGTAASQTVTNERARLLETARQQWAESRARLDELRAKGEFAEAIALCDRLARVHNGITETTDRIAETRRALAAQKREAESRALFEKEAAAQARAAKLAVLQTQSAALITTFQWEKGRQEIAALLAEAGNDAEWRATLEAQAAEYDALLALRDGVAARLKTKPVGPVTLATRRGEMQGEVTGVDATHVHLQQRFGAAGFAETAFLWTELTPASVCRFLRLALDPQQPQELWGYAVLLARFALAKQARIEDARLTLQAIAQRDPARAAWADKYLVQLAELEAGQQKTAAQRQLEADAAAVWQQLQQALVQGQWSKVSAAVQLLQTDYASTEFVKARAGELQQAARQLAERAAPPTGYQPLDLSSAYNVEFILDQADQQVDRGMEGRTTYAREGYFRDATLKALPANGRLAVPDAEAGGFFQLQVAPGKDAIALTWDGGRYPNTVRCELPAPQQRAYRRLAILSASSVRRATVRLTLQYDNGPPEAAVLKIADWSGNRAEDAVVAFAGTASDGSRPAQMYLQVVEPDATRRLTALNFTWVSATTESPHHCVAIFAISGWPADTK